ncbi:hypothetical protein HJ049_03810 [Vibrio parahaemolyticus]|nr:hypothetical protein [Vibrio alginolyticus]MBE5178984.1 hypothetical protein [Vibrio parahaemolyticus]
MEIKPRIYNGVEFRSTLEAKWARFFDLLGWDWKYEPFKLTHDDITWVPDFVISGHGNNPIYCEVKPSESPQEWYELDRYSYALNLQDNRYSILLLLGKAPLPKGESSSGAAIGWILQPSTMQVEPEMFFNSQPLGICDEYSSWVCKITGNYYSQPLPVSWEVIQKLWIKASSEAEAFPVCEEPIHPIMVVKT